MKIRETLALVGVLTSTFVLFMKVIQPTILQVVVDGDVIESKVLPTVYTLTDVAFVTISSMAIVVCLVYLFQSNKSIIPIESGQEHWNITFQKLVDPDEQVLYKIVMDEKGSIFQGELVDRSGFSKSKVSLILDRLEAQHILERKRYGMSNLVQLR
jgi:hypothetical protein